MLLFGALPSHVRRNVSALAIALPIYRQSPKYCELAQNQVQNMGKKKTIIYLSSCHVSTVRALATYIFFDSVVMEDLNNLYGPHDRCAGGVNGEGHYTSMRS